MGSVEKISPYNHKHENLKLTRVTIVRHFLASFIPGIKMCSLWSDYNQITLYQMKLHLYIHSKCSVDGF